VTVQTLVALTRPPARHPASPGPRAGRAIPPADSCRLGLTRPPPRAGATWPSAGEWARPPRAGPR